MATSSNKAANDKYRAEVVKKLMDYFLSEAGGEEWVMQISSNAFGFPIVNSEGNEEVIKITVSIPSGSRDGEPYDLEGEAEDYKAKTTAKAEKAKKAAIEKEKKIELDKRRREAAAKLKEKRNSQ